MNRIRSQIRAAAVKGGKIVSVPSTESEMQAAKVVSGWMTGGKEMSTSTENNGFKMPVSHPNTQTVKVEKGQGRSRTAHR